MAKRLPDIITTCTPEQMFHALAMAWVEMFDEVPKINSILVLLCQWALETGWGKSCHCWNIGNFKSHDGDGYDYVYYKCDERYPEAQAKQYLTSVGVRVHIGSDGMPDGPDSSGLPNAALESKNSDGTWTIYFWPDHPVSRFRASITIEDGVKIYLASMFNRFSKAWPAVKAGDPDAFVHLLKLQGYFTADEEQYRKTEHSVFNTLSAKHFDMSNLPILSSDHASQIQGLIALTLSQEADTLPPDSPDKSV
jgi:hypothetical protein